MCERCDKELCAVPQGKPLENIEKTLRNLIQTEEEERRQKIELHIQQLENLLKELVNFSALLKYHYINCLKENINDIDAAIKILSYFKAYAQMSIGTLSTIEETIKILENLLLNTG